jgi:[ribosomal protein S5]-alanine N-acetyltransferase
MIVIYETERLRVRQYTEADADIFHLLNSDEEVMRYIRPVQTREESDKALADYIAFYREYPQMGRWAVEEKISGKQVGRFAIIFIPGSEKIQLGYSLFREEWGKGYATELTRGGLQFVFEEMKLPLIYTVTEVANIPSQHVLIKTGFAEELRYTENSKALIRYIIYRQG